MSSIQPFQSAASAYQTAVAGYQAAIHARSQNHHMNEDAEAGQAQTQLIGHTYNAVVGLSQQIQELREDVAEIRQNQPRL